MAKERYSRDAKNGAVSLADWRTDYGMTDQLEVNRKAAVAGKSRERKTSLLATRI